MALPRWIFFDCCRTLLCIDDVRQYWTRMAPAPVKAGLCPSEEAFNQAYTAWQKRRRQEASQIPHPEISLPDGLGQTLVALNPSISPADVETIVGRMVEAFLTDYLARTRPAPGVRQMLDAWQGIAKMGVVSDFFLSDCPRRLLAEYGLDGYFEFVLDSASVGFRKPAEEIYREALRKAGLERERADEVLFIGDNLTLDVIMPISMGMRATHYDPNHKSQSIEGKHRSHLSIGHWDEFRPDLVAVQGGLS